MNFFEELIESLYYEFRDLFDWRVKKHSCIEIGHDLDIREKMFAWCNDKNNLKGPYEFTQGFAGGRPTFHFKLEVDAEAFKTVWMNKMTDERNEDRLWADEAPKEEPKPKSKSLADFGVPLTGQGGILMSKSKNRFRVIFHDFDDDGLILTRQTVTCDLPKITFKIKHDEKYNTYTTEENPMWEPSKFLFRDDIANTVLQKILNHLQKQMKNKTLEFSVTIEALDGSNNKVTATYKMEGCQILHFDTGALSYVSPAACELVLVVKYKNAVIS